MKALVTGASRGLGAAIFEALADGSPSEGHELIGVYRSAHAQAQAQVAAAQARGVQARMVAAQLGDEAEITSLVEQLPRLDAVVFNAGIAMRAPFTDAGGPDLAAAPDPIDAQLELDLAAPLKLLRALLRANKVTPGASLVFVSSNLARHGLAHKVAYAAAKAGIEGAVRSLAKELGAAPLRARVNAVAPGLMRTDMTRDAGDAGYAAYAREVPLGRVGEAADVAGLVAFLLSDKAAYISGQIVDVDGGWGC